MIDKTTFRNFVYAYPSDDYEGQTFARYFAFKYNADIPRNNDPKINLAYDRYMTMPETEAKIAAAFGASIAFFAAIAAAIAFGIVLPHAALATCLLIAGVAAVGGAVGLITYCASSAIRFNILYNAVNDAINAGNNAVRADHSYSIETPKPALDTVYTGGDTTQEERERAAAAAATWTF